MRDTYREQLDGILSDLVTMNQKVTVAVRHSTRALLEADLQQAEAVISADDEIDEMRTDLELRAFQLLARQSPVAGELRMLVASLRMVTELERMGDLAAHVAKIARLRFPECAIPDPMRDNFVRMAEVAEKMVHSAGKVLADRDVAAAQDVQDRDQEMDDLRRSQFHSLLGDDWTHGVEAAVDVALLGRYYERIADHADSMARRVVYIVTGNFPEDDDTEAWPEP